MPTTYYSCLAFLDLNTIRVELLHVYVYLHPAVAALNLCQKHTETLLGCHQLITSQFSEVAAYYHTSIHRHIRASVLVFRACMLPPILVPPLASCPLLLLRHSSPVDI